MATIICIIDAYSTGKHLARTFKKEGYACIHVKSSPVLPPRYQYREEDFIASYIYENDLDRLLEELQAHGDLKFCIPGYESGVELADLLSEHFGFRNNGSQYSTLRRNKFDMCEAVAESGLAIISHFKHEECSKILQWASAQWEKDPHKPIVLKPLSSANGDNVHFCYNSSELEAAFGKITSNHNQFGIKNREVLAERFNDGIEYIVNTVSWEGRHLIAEMWRIYRKPQTTIYDKAEMMRPEDKEWNSIETYTFKVLDALKIRYGAGTTELKYTAENGPILLETSARLMGGANIAFSEEILGFSQLSLLVEAYLNPQKFLIRMNSVRKSPKVHGMDILLISNNFGKLQVDISSAIEKLGLASYHSSLCLNKGDELVKTSGQDSTPGEIFLASEDKDILIKDYAKIRKWEEQFYKEAVYITAPRVTQHTLTIS